MKDSKQRLLTLKKESEKDCEIEKGIFGLEITTTQACNYRCSYCFEKTHDPEEKLLDTKIIVRRIHQLLNTDWFNEQYSGIKIILWGGEPTLNRRLCEDLMMIFENNERICFFIYTNGSTMNSFISALRRIKNKPFIKKDISKFTVQVSYDGNPIHDIRRLDTKGQGTSLQAREALGLLHRYGIDYGLKATVTWQDYHLIPQSWDDFDGLHTVCGSKIKYALTVDYYDVQFRKHKQDVEDSLIFISQREIGFYKKHGYFLSNIFRLNRAFCATGKSMAVVDTNGDVFYCHGAIYSKCSDELKYTNIFSKNFINSLEKANKFFYDNHIEPDECHECISTSCLRCNVKKYEESKKETFKEKWFDYPAQKELCEYYQLVGKVGAAMRSIIKE